MAASAALARAPGLARQVIRLGIEDLRGTVPHAAPGRRRRPGGGRKKLVATDPTVRAALEWLGGDGKNGGREWRPAGQPEAVRVRDFVIPGLGRVSPYGVYDRAANVGWVSGGIDHDTAAFAAAHRRRRGQQRRAGAAVRRRDGADGQRVPPPARHQHWRGKPLVRYAAIRQRIAATTTATGLTVASSLDTTAYPTGQKIADAEMAARWLERAAFHGAWHSTRVPRALPDEDVIP